MASALKFDIPVAEVDHIYKRLPFLITGKKIQTRERGHMRTHRFFEKTHAGLFRSASTFCQVALAAASDNIFSCRAATARTRDHVVDV